MIDGLITFLFCRRKRLCVCISGFAILYMLVTVPLLLPWNTKGTLVGILSWCHLIGAVSPWVGSFLYHLFMNVNYDEVFYRTLLKVDMIGIWLCQSFGDSLVDERLKKMCDTNPYLFEQRFLDGIGCFFFFFFFFNEIGRSFIKSDRSKIAPFHLSREYNARYSFPWHHNGLRSSIECQLCVGAPFHAWFISGAIPMMAAAVHCLADNIWYCCISIYCTLSFWGLLKVMHCCPRGSYPFRFSRRFLNRLCDPQAMTADSPWERRLCFAPPFLMRMLVMTLRCFGIGGGSPEALIHIILQVRWVNVSHSKVCFVM